MMSEIETGASQTKQAFQDAGYSVLEGARAPSSRFEHFVRAGLRMLPLVPDRMIEAVLDRVGLMRSASGLGPVAVFASGFAAGSVVTALTTPFTGTQLRRRIWTAANGAAQSAEKKTITVAKDAVATEKRVLKQAKSLVGNGSTKSTRTPKKSGARGTRAKRAETHPSNGHRPSG